jgi:tight adherence protein B
VNPVPIGSLNPLNAVIAAATSGLVLCAWAALVLLWFRRRRAHQETIEQRIGLLDGPASEGRVLRLWHDGAEATTLVPAHSAHHLRGRLEVLIREAGWQISASQLALAVIAAAAVTFALTLVASGRLLAAIGGAAAVVMVFWAFFNQRIARRAALFELQLVDALELAGRSLRVGHPLIGAFQLISEELGAPVGTIFGTICQQQGLGVSLTDALRHVADEHHNEDLQLFAAAVVIQLRSGGSLADMMERLSQVIRERLRLARRVRVLTSQTQMSKRILQAMPLLVFVLLNVINPDYMRPLYATESGKTLLMVAGGCILVGSALMNRLSLLRY